MDIKKYDEAHRIMTNIEQCEEVLRIIDGIEERKTAKGFSFKYYLPSGGFPAFYKDLPRDLDIKITDLIRNYKEELVKEIKEL